MANNDEECIIALITSPCGFVVEIFGLSIYRLENGDFQVCNGDSWNEDTKDFPDVKEAVSYFLQLREKTQRGFDFEDY
jgi:hypothetical protein